MLLQEDTIASCISQLVYHCSGCSMLSINESCNQNASLNVFDRHCWDAACCSRI